MINIQFFLFQEVEVKPMFVAAFNGKSYIERPGLDASLLTSIDLVFMSKKSDAILVYNGNSNGNQFLGIKLQNSFVHFVVSIDGKHEILM